MVIAVWCPREVVVQAFAVALVAKLAKQLHGKQFFHLATIRRKNREQQVNRQMIVEDTPTGQCAKFPRHGQLASPRQAIEKDQSHNVSRLVVRVAASMRPINLTHLLLFCSVQDSRVKS
jgi:hypothetical protein